MEIGAAKDILYIVISICIVWVTVFLCWSLYYTMRILRSVNTVVEEFRTRFMALAETLHYIRGKVEGISNIMTAATSGVGGLVKKVAKKKAHEWMDMAMSNMDNSAKEAVDRAVEETAKSMKKAAKKIRREM